MLFAFLRVSRARPEPPSHVALAGAFMLGYLVVWTGYSLLATAVQWALHAATLLTPSMRSSSAAFSSALLIVAGIYQFTPFTTHAWQGAGSRSRSCLLSGATACEAR
jgi:predicted metal-binding membrane protein